MVPVDRRAFLRRSTAIAGGALVAPAVLEGLVNVGLAPGGSRVYAAPGAGSYGPLSPVADGRDGVMRLSLPAGFQYKSFGGAGTPMSDGNLTPLAHDGMAAFAMPNGNLRLVRNHEDRNAPGTGSVAGDPTKKYDALGGGGTTTIEINPTTRAVVQDFISLNGTIVNCAGGLTPWGSWLTCEETTVGTSRGWGQPHGYVFEVPASENAPVPAVPLKPMGRFAHEAVAIDPATGVVYETEDNSNTSGFYRFIPARPGNLSAGGKLQMLAIKGKVGYDTTSGQQVGRPLPVDWVEIAQPDPSSVDTNSRAVFDQGLALGGANFARLEGAWYAEGSIFFVSTSGGDAGYGQVWEYRPLGTSGGQITLIFESAGAAQLDAPDNICATPRGGLLLCEDGDNDQYLRGLTRQGAIFDFAKNLSNDYEWAGATFSPDGQTLFVNRQGNTRGLNPPAPGQEGMTFAIWGPWENGAL